MIKNALIRIRNLINRIYYKVILKPIFFFIDPEKIHYLAIKAGQLLGAYFTTRILTKMSYSYSNKMLEQDILGIQFKNPIGLAAGFDKNGQITNILPSIGFGFMEVGSVTGEPCKGNPKPRLWRLKKSRGLIVYYGLKNDGCEKVAQRLQKKHFKIPLGINIAKTNCKETVDTEAGIHDYVKAYKTLQDIGDYMVINISCPNAFGGQPFTNAKDLNNLLRAIEKYPTNKPVFLKLPPDLPKSELDEVLEVSAQHKIAGFICTNLTKDRANESIKSKIIEKEFSDKGGISGKVIEELADEVIKYVYKKTRSKYIIIGCGGIFSAEDAYKKIKLGASLVQLITGMIFEGPQLISEINLGLMKLLKKDGFKNITEAIGKDNQ